MADIVPEIELILCRPEIDADEIHLFYDLRPTAVARRYFEALQECVNQRLTIFERDRFYNFPGDVRNRPWIAKELNRHIDTINAYAPLTIPERADPGLAQETMNLLHHHFETLRGSIERPARFFQTAPPAVRKAIEDYNILIHRYEDFVVNEEWMRRGEPPRCRAVLTFDPARARLPLRDEDYAHFTPAIEFGGWYIGYCEVGKPLWDVFLNEDEIIGDDNIRPLRHYSADALLQFSRPFSNAELVTKMEHFYTWWDRHAEKLKTLGFRKYDDRNAIGHIPVAHLKRDKGEGQGTDSDVLRLVGQFQHIKGLQVT